MVITTDARGAQLFLLDVALDLVNGAGATSAETVRAACRAFVDTHPPRNRLTLYRIVECKARACARPWAPLGSPDDLDTPFLENLLALVPAGPAAGAGF